MSYIYYHLGKIQLAALDECSLSSSLFFIHSFFYPFIFRNLKKLKVLYWKLV